MSNGDTFVPLELTQLRDSLQALTESLAVSEDEARMGEFSTAVQEAIRSGVIKQFEITYELSWKLMKRWLNTQVAPGIADSVSRRQLFRLAAERRLIADVDVWAQHHEARNLTAHIYDRKIADEVYRATREFVHDARYLLNALETRND